MLTLINTFHTLKCYLICIFSLTLSVGIWKHNQFILTSLYSRKGFPGGSDGECLSGLNISFQLMKFSFFIFANNPPTNNLISFPVHMCRISVEYQAQKHWRWASVRIGTTRYCRRAYPYSLSTSSILETLLLYSPHSGASRVLPTQCMCDRLRHLLQFVLPFV